MIDIQTMKKSNNSLIIVMPTGAGNPSIFINASFSNNLSLRFLLSNFYFILTVLIQNKCLCYPSKSSFLFENGMTTSITA